MSTPETDGPAEHVADRTTDHDSPWKMALHKYFQDFLLLIFP